MLRLRDVLNARPRDRVIAAPGVYDMVSLRMAASMGFDALYMTGYGTVASHLGLPDAGLASYAEMVERVQVMAQTAGAPLIADGDTGYGNFNNMQRLVRKLEQRHIAAVRLQALGLTPLNVSRQLRGGPDLRPQDFLLHGVVDEEYGPSLVVVAGDDASDRFLFHLTPRADGCGPHPSGPLCQCQCVRGGAEPRRTDRAGRARTTGRARRRRHRSPHRRPDTRFPRWWYDASEGASVT